MNTKERITILNVMTYQDKQTKEIKSRIGFVLSDEKHKQITNKFKGHNELSCFYNGDITEEFPATVFLTPVIGIFDLQPSKTNPLKQNTILKGFEFKGHVYTLVQS